MYVKSLPIKKLRLYNFRNISEASLDFKSQISVFVGKNGQGKTNISESLYFLSRAKSFRTNKIEHLVKHGETEANLCLEFENDNLNYELKGTIQSDKKVFNLNEKKTSPAQIYKKLPTIFFSPESLQSVKEGPELRRNLIDETLVISDANLILLYFEYKKTLNMRNKVLKDIASYKITKTEGLAILESLNPRYAELSVKLTSERKKIINKLQPYLEGIFRDITNDSNVKITVEYVDSLSDIETCRKELDNAIHKDLKLGYTQIGPHKHDIKFLYNGKDSRFFSSQGQQRALILAFKFSQIMYHKEVYEYYPTMILDDVLSELDWEKKKYLLNFLRSSEAQAFLTTTEFEKQDAQNLDATILNVENGVIS